MPALKVGTGQADKIKTCSQMAREQRLAGEIFGRMLIVGVDSLSAYVRPVAGSIVIPPKPHEGHEIDLFIVRKVRDERGQFCQRRTKSSDRWAARALERLNLLEKELFEEHRPNGSPDQIWRSAICPLHTDADRSATWSASSDRNSN